MDNRALCFQEVMSDPVVAADSFTYERTAITQWFASGKRTSPLTGLDLVHRNVVANFALKQLIRDWRERRTERRR